MNFSLNLKVNKSNIKPMVKFKRPKCLRVLISLINSLIRAKVHVNFYVDDILKSKNYFSDYLFSFNNNVFSCNPN